MGALQWSRLRLLALAAMVVLCSSMLCGCRTTDFFTEVIHTWDTDKEDVDNPNKEKINSPDADEESDELAALDWDEDAKKTTGVQKLVVYSKDPNTDLTSRHSLFALTPNLKDVESSDPVDLVYDRGALLDAQANMDEVDQNPDEAKTRVAGGDSDDEEPDQDANVKADTQTNAEEATSPQSNDNAIESPASETSSTDAASGDNEENDSSKQNDNSNSRENASGGSESNNENNDNNGTGNNNQGNGDDANPSGAGSDGDNWSNISESPGDEGDEGDGQTEDPPNAGVEETPTGGGTAELEEKRYDPNNRRSRPQKADRIAACGQAAVIVQMIGGKGALCAMDRWTYDGLGSTKEHYASWEGTFSQIFGFSGANELADNFEQEAILWQNDGSSSEDLIDAKALAEACGEGGVIVYEQGVSSLEERFTDEQANYLNAKNIQLVPIDLSSVQGMKDAASVVGEILTNSPCEQDAPSMARLYAQTVDNIVVAASATHGGTLEQSWSGASGARLQTVYNSCPVRSFSFNLVKGALAVDCDLALRYRSSNEQVYGTVDFEDVGLFCFKDASQSPSAFWFQCAGVADNLKGFQGTESGLSFIMNRQDLSVDLAANFDLFNVGAEYDVNPLHTDWEQAYSMEHGSDCLGAPTFPYLVIAGTGDNSSSEVKNAVVSSMLSTDGAYSIESGLRPCGGIWPHMGYIGWYSKLEGPNSITYNAFTDGGVDPNDVVRQNPCGLLGSWVSSCGSLESVLEAIWLAQLYSSNANPLYEPINDMSSFSVNIGEYSCTTLEEAVLAFYQTFYRYDAAGIYESIVPDEGL